ncbi:MAG: DUF4185 domain-containing protein [bacterium]|nr:DUF4185 domain-containing protein [bacterium]
MLMFSLIALVGAAGCGQRNNAEEIDAPLAPSSSIAGVAFDFSTHRKLAPGSDNWPMTWSDDDHQYSAWGDGGGFDGTNSKGRVSLGFARIEGPPSDYRGFNQWGGANAASSAEFDGKSYGILSVGGVLYAWIGPGSGADSYREARLHRSTDKARTWTAADWSYVAADGVILPAILNYGKDNAAARDEFVYHYFIGLQRFSEESKLGVQRPGEIFLARVPETRIFDAASHYEWFTGTDADGAPKWSSRMSEKRHVFFDRNGVGFSLSVSYNSGLKRYILCTEHTSSFEGNLGMFDAPEPWGPWTTVAYLNRRNGTEFGAGSKIARQTFFWNFAPKWVTDDGKSFTLVFTGIGESDAWNTLQGSFSLVD